MREELAVDGYATHWQRLFCYLRNSSFAKSQ